jgi:predicted small integral membrane protein
MELTPTKLLVACGALFAGIVALNVVTQYRSNADLRDKFSSMDFSSLRSRLIKQEGIADDLPFYEPDPEEPILKED